MRKQPKSFEEAIEKLENIVNKLEIGELPLDNSLEIFEEGIQLSQYCTMKLNEFEKRISVICDDGKGSIKEKDFIVKEEKDGFSE